MQVKMQHASQRRQVVAQYRAAPRSAGLKWTLGVHLHGFGAGQTRERADEAGRVDLATWSHSLDGGRGAHIGRDRVRHGRAADGEGTGL